MNADPELAGLREQVRRTFSAIAKTPGAEHPFAVGRRLAGRAGYPGPWLTAVPAASVDAFAGVSCLPCFAEVPASAAVLDLGCGAGLDALLVAAAGGAVLGVDFSAEMLSRARSSAAAMGVTSARFVLGDAEALPAPTASFDVAVVNGIFNLNPARDEIFSELARVVRPGGSVFAAELVLKAQRPAAAHSSGVDWFS